MTSKLILTIVLIFTSIFANGVKPGASPAKQESHDLALDEPVPASVCDIAKDPAAYNHKRVEVTGFVSRGFEDSGLFDPACSSRYSIWVEIGGKSGTGVMYCCGVPANESRPKS